MKMQSRGRRERDGAWVPCGRHQLAPSAFRVCAFSCRAGCAGGPDHERFSRWGLERRSIPPGPPPTGRTRPPRSRRSPGFDHRLLAPISAPAALRGQIQFAADVVVVDPRPPRSADRQIAFDVANPNSPGTGIGDADSAADFPLRIVRFPEPSSTMTSPTTSSTVRPPEPSWTLTSPPAPVIRRLPDPSSTRTGPVRLRRSEPERSLTTTGPTSETVMAPDVSSRSMAALDGTRTAREMRA